MSDLPYTYTDPDTGAVLTVDSAGDIQIMSGESGHYCAIPSGEDAPALARAILAAGGDTGHVVMSTASIDSMTLNWREAAARSMREQAALLAAEGRHWGDLLAEDIRTLPLFPDGEPKKSGRVEWLEIDGKQVHPKPDVVHVATPEGITPCGQGTRDVTTSPLIPEVTCVGCLQAIAMEKGLQIIEMRDERDRLRTAWGSARRGRAQARETAEMLRFFAGEAEADVIRLRRELRNAREVTVRLPEEDMAVSERADRHDPTACTHLACPDCRLAQIERDMGRVEHRLAALEIAERERTQSGGADHVQVAGGGYAEADDH